MNPAKETAYIDYEGIPVTYGVLGPYLCTAWDTSPPRKFDPDSAQRNGALRSRADWLSLKPKLGDWAQRPDTA